MRIAPLVLLHPQGTSAALWLDAALASIVTHRDASSVASCVAFVDLLARLLRLPAPPTADWIIATFVATGVKSAGPAVLCPQRALHRPRGFLSDYLEFVLGEAARHDWSVRRSCEAWSSGAYLLETVPTCCGSCLPRARPRGRSCVPSTISMTTDPVKAIAARPNRRAAWQRCSARRLATRKLARPHDGRRQRAYSA
ncbi:MAG: ADP-ribosylglycohydrolase family protein [Proteobacteria bacterium]|nr:ADP-ribosylglycohydrolase family protein [Pseudomonadota bacterium]